MLVLCEHVFFLIEMDCVHKLLLTILLMYSIPSSALAGNFES